MAKIFNLTAIVRFVLPLTMELKGFYNLVFQDLHCLNLYLYLLLFVFSMTHADIYQINE